jgi:hypothetical protein
MSYHVTARRASIATNRRITVAVDVDVPTCHKLYRMGAVERIIYLLEHPEHRDMWHVFKGLPLQFNPPVYTELKYHENALSI